MKPVAIITGAGRGIGRACAIDLAARGYVCVLVSRTEADLREVAGLCAGSVVARCDVIDREGIAWVVGRAVEEFGRVDALVNCAGMAPSLGILQTTDEDWDAVIATNLTAVFVATRAVWPVFERQRSGVVVSISSMASRDPFPGFAAYAAAKAGVNLFSLVAAREGASIGVRVHVVAPGATETEMFRALPGAKDWPTEKVMDPADVARVVGLCVTGELQCTSGEVIYLQRHAR